MFGRVRACNTDGVKDDRGSGVLRASCPACGTVEVALQDAQLVMPATHDTDRSNRVQCPCPRCGQGLSVRVDARMTRVLTATDIAVGLPWTSPPAPSRSTGGSPDSP
jgi:predicted RNA-binding Zn-ribbon protein involved in translation (DUF1610 family)